MSTQEDSGDKKADTDFPKLLQDFLPEFPVVGDEITGKIFSVAKTEVLVDIEGFTVGVIRGRELKDVSGEYDNFKEGEEITAKVIDLENEHGQIELSLREAGEEKAWSKIQTSFERQDIIDVRIDEVNKGGLLARVYGVGGFLPVSQLSSDNYPRVEGGDKNKILKALKKFVGKIFKVKVITVDREDEKVIVSEKAAWEDSQKSKLSDYKKGSEVEGEVKAIASFGVFIGFGEGLEGLIHISELSWKRVDDPRDLVSIGDKVKAQILEITGTKVFLSIKRLTDDPWRKAAENYQVGQVIKGTVAKINNFGAFVDLEDGLQGLAHISEFADHRVTDPHRILKIGEDREFRIIDLNPNERRIGLSIKALKNWNPAGANESAESEKSGDLSADKKPSLDEDGKEKQKEDDKKADGAKTGTKEKKGEKTKESSGDSKPFKPEEEKLVKKAEKKQKEKSSDESKANEEKLAS